MPKKKQRKQTPKPKPRPANTQLMGQVGIMRLTSALLELAAHEFDARGPRELDLRQFLPRVDARRELMRAFHEWDGTPDQFDPAREYETVSDVATMQWLAAQIDQRVETLLSIGPPS